MITVEDVEEQEKKGTSATPDSIANGDDADKKKKLIKYAIIGVVGAVALYFVYTKVIVKKKAVATGGGTATTAQF